MRVAIAFNQPYDSRYNRFGEEVAVQGILDAVASVNKALLEIGCEVIQVPLLPPMEKIEQDLKAIKANLVFNLFEGLPENPVSEAFIPEVLERQGIPYTGCPASALRLGLNKAGTKKLMKAAKIPTPDYQVLNPKNVGSFRLKYPCIVKPAAEDASHGLSGDSVVYNAPALKKQVGFISENYGGNALVEEFLEGREFNATVLGNTECIVLPPSEIVYSLPKESPKILTFAAKWEPGTPYYIGTEPVCPAVITDLERKEITEVANRSYRIVGCRGYARVDMRMDAHNHVNVIEVNPNPDISPTAGSSRQATVAGMTYTEFIARILNLALGEYSLGT